MTQGGDSLSTQVSRRRQWPPPSPAVYALPCSAPLCPALLCPALHCSALGCPHCRAEGGELAALRLYCSLCVRHRFFFRGGGWGWGASVWAVPKRERTGCGRRLSLQETRARLQTRARPNAAHGSPLTGDTRPLHIPQVTKLLSYSRGGAQVFEPWTSPYLIHTLRHAFLFQWIYPTSPSAHPCVMTNLAFPFLGWVSNAVRRLKVGRRFVTFMGILETCFDSKLSTFLCLLKKISTCDFQGDLSRRHLRTVPESYTVKNEV